MNIVHVNFSGNNKDVELRNSIRASMDTRTANALLYAKSLGLDVSQEALSIASDKELLSYPGIGATGLAKIRAWAGKRHATVSEVEPESPAALLGELLALAQEHGLQGDAVTKAAEYLGVGSV